MPKRLLNGRGILTRPLEKRLIALQGAVTGDGLIKAAMALVDEAIRCDFLAASLRIEPHPYGLVAYRIIDSMGRDFGPQLADGVLFRDHPAVPVLMANPGTRFVNTRETLPPNEILHASRFYREAMQPLGFRHAIGMYFWGDPPTIPEVVFAPCRVEGQPDFSDEDVAVLDHLYPHIDAALRRVRASDQERAVRRELRRLIDRPNPACVLRWDLTVAEANRAAREICARWNRSESSAHLKPPPFRLPEELRDACAELKKRWSASLQHHPEAGTRERSTIRHPSRPSLGATVSLHIHRADPLGKPALLIEFDPPSADRSSPRKTGSPRLAHFTLRERELIRMVCEGKTNQEIASETGRALGSVKNALHAIFGKAGVHSRGALISQIGSARNQRA